MWWHECKLRHLWVKINTEQAMNFYMLRIFRFAWIMFDAIVLVGTQYEHDHLFIHVFLYFISSIH